MDRTALREQIDSLLGAGDLQQIEKLIVMNQETAKKDNDLLTVYHLLPACKQEKAAGQSTMFEKAGNIKTLMERYTRLKFFFRRIDFDVMDDGLEELYDFLSRYKISSYELLLVLKQSTVHREKVLQYIKGV